MTVRTPLGAGIAGLLALGLITPATASAERTSLKVMTANVAFGKGSQDRVRRLFRTSAAKADVVLMQEVRDVKLTKKLTGPGWAIRQNRSTSATRGSAVVVRKASVRTVGDLILTKAVEAHPCGLGDRFIANVPLVLANGTQIRAASLHMPPIRCATGLGSPYARMADNVVQFARNVPAPLIIGADWNKVVDDDPNDIGKRTDMEPRGLDGGKRIDGFMIEHRPAMRAGEPRRLAKFGSDHQPVLLRVSFK